MIHSQCELALRHQTLSMSMTSVASHKFFDSASARSFSRSSSVSSPNVRCGEVEAMNRSASSETGVAWVLGRRRFFEGSMFTGITTPHNYATVSYPHDRLVNVDERRLINPWSVATVSALFGARVWWLLFRLLVFVVIVCLPWSLAGVVCRKEHEKGRCSRSMRSRGNSSLVYRRG